MMVAYASILAFHNVICLDEKSQKGQEFNPLGHGKHMYMHPHAYPSPREASIYDCGVNLCLLHTNKSRPYLSTYITTQEGQQCGGTNV